MADESHIVPGAEKPSPKPPSSKAPKRKGAWKVIAVVVGLLATLLVVAAVTKKWSTDHSSTTPLGTTLPATSSLSTQASVTTVDYANSPGEPPSAVVLTTTSPTSSGTQPPYPHDAYHPNLSITPGAVFAGVTAAQVCVSGYSASVRNVTDSMRTRVFAEYNITNPPSGAYEVDHLVSLELGGSNDIRNLWPEPYTGLDNAHDKDTIENKLHAEVCAGTITLAAAQVMIINWDGLLGSVTAPTVAPMTQPPATTQPAATTQPTTTTAGSGYPIVTSGSFCSPPGTYGQTSAGTLMICSLTKKDGTLYGNGQARWRSP